MIWVIAAGFRTQISLLIGEFLFSPVLTTSRRCFFRRPPTSFELPQFAVVGITSTLLCLVVATLAAWSLHRMRWPFWVRHSFSRWAMVFHMIPPIMLAGAWFTMARDVGLDNTLHRPDPGAHRLEPADGALADGRLRARRAHELEEAARIDGASTPVLLWQIVLPIIAPGLAATGILTFVFSWNEFAVALNLTTKQTATVPVGIAKFAQDFEIQYTADGSSAALSILPALVLLLIGQRYIVKGLTQGAVK